MIGKSIDAAKFWVSNAVSYYKVHGKERSIAEFSNPKGAFKARDLYIFVINLDGVVIAHGADEQYIGRDFKKLSDSTGKSIFEEIIQIANTDGNGEMKYWWINPATQRVELKNTYFEKIDDVIICSGVYR